MATTARHRTARKRFDVSAVVARATAVVGALLVVAIAGYASATEWRIAALLVGLGVAACCVSAALTWPRESLLACVPLLFLASTKFRLRDPLASAAGNLDAQIIYELTAYAVMALLVLVVAIKFRVGPAYSRSAAALTVFVLIAVASVGWSPVPSITAVRSAQLVILLVLAMYTLAVCGSRATLTVIGVSAAVYALIGAAITVVFPASQTVIVVLNEPDRFSWFAVHPLLAATYCAIAILVVAALWMRARIPLARGALEVPSYIYPLVLLGLLLILLVTKQRGPLIALVAASGLSVLRRQMRAWQIPLLIVAVLFFAMVVSPVELVTPLLEKLASTSGLANRILLRGQSVEQVTGFSGRVDLWRGLFPIFLGRPLLGYGYQGSREYVLAIMPWAGYAHNAYFQLLLDFGLAGAAMFTFAFGRMLMGATMRRDDDSSDARWVRSVLFALGIFFLLSGVTDESFAGQTNFSTFVIFFAMLAIEPLKRTTMSRAP